MSAQSLLGILQIRVARGGQDELPLYQPFLKLGRSKGNDVILADPNVSGEHSRLIWGQEGWLVEDLNSRNGTYVNGRRLVPGQATALRPGDVVQINGFALWIRPLQPGEEPPPRLSNRVRISSVPQPGLAVYQGNQLLKFPLEKDVVTLGRRSDNDIQLPNLLVSGQHARLERRGATYCIMDLQSRNGLIYQGRRIDRHCLADGDVLYIGNQIALQYRAHVGFLPTEVQRTEAPRTQYLDMRCLPQDGRGITIGRHKDNVLRLEHPRVSRFHAIIERFGTRFRLRDLESDNGTFVNGKRVEKETWIKEGDEIRIASFRLVFREDGITHFDEAGYIRLDALHLEQKISKDRTLLNDISLSIYPHEFVAIVGDRGAGKTTLLHALNGFKPANGRRSQVMVNGRSLYTHIDEYRGDIGYVPQKNIIHEELTVYKALDYAAQLRMPADTATHERHQQIEKVLRTLNLDQQRNNVIGSQLSGGQQRCVSIGVELLSEPTLFFLDEATTGLDPGAVTDLMELLRRLADEGRIIILVTHATRDIMMCDQVVFLTEEGYLAYFGPPNEALAYFDRYRSDEERRRQDIEFADIYKLLKAKGKPSEWAERFRHSQQYREYVVKRLKTLKEQKKTPYPLPVTRRRKRPISAFRQFMILSARNLRIMAQDKASLALMLAVAPFIGALDFIWGKKLFDPVEGDAARIIMMFFMMGLIAILAGSLSSVREIVKEVDIYKRERMVVLKIMPYILSKIWIGVILAAYQAGVFLLTKKIFVDPQLTGPGGYPAMYVTVFLCTLSGYMIGLFISAASPNQNVALFLVLGVLVPQFLFAGALLPLDFIPGGRHISVITSSRWSFEALVRISGIGDDVANDPCWQLPKEQWDDLTQEDKDRLGCRCMGKQMFEQCYFPGIRNPAFYNPTTQAQLRATELVRPPSPTPYPTFTPYPVPTPLPTPGLFDDQTIYQQKMKKQAQEYQKKREIQGEEYQKLIEGQFQEYQKASEQYGQDLQKQKMQQEKAIRGAEGIIKQIYQDFEEAFKGGLENRWLAMGGIIIVFFVLTLIFQTMKDVI